MQQKATLFKEGLERHVWPAGDGQGIVTKKSSDKIFGPNGLGLGNTFWTTILSYLARTGIQEQTGSNKGETNIENCVKGWGQGAYSSRIFDVDKGVDQQQLDEFIEHLTKIAAEYRTPDGRFTDKVLGSFIATQIAEPYSTINGIREAKTRGERFTAVFRGHVQWLGFVTLCGQVDKNGVVHVTPELLKLFFNSGQPFFERLSDRRRQLKEGGLTVGDPSGLLADAPEHIDLKATDVRYKKNKSGLWLILKIARYMLFPPRAKTGPLVRKTTT